MSWLLNRAMLAIVLTLVGAGVGAIVGDLVDARQLGPAIGAAIAVAIWVTVDGVRALHLMNWLRGDLGREAPRDRGFWGEASYRIERALRQRDRGLALERDRFGQFMSAVEASPNGVLLLDAADQIQWLNAVAATHFGLDPVRDRLQRVTNLVRSRSVMSCVSTRRMPSP